MNPLLVRDAAYILGVSPERVFGLAFEYEEEPRPRKYIVNQFLDWYHDNKLNPIVADYVLDVLAGRVQPIKAHESTPKK